MPFSKSILSKHSAATRALGGLEPDVCLKLTYGLQIRQAVGTVGQMPQGDEGVRLAADVVDGELAVRFIGPGVEAQADVLDQFPQVVGRLSESEELGRVLVDGTPPFLHNHVIQVGGEYGQRKLAGFEVVPQFNYLVPGFQCGSLCHFDLA